MLTRNTAKNETQKAIATVATIFPMGYVCSRSSSDGRLPHHPVPSAVIRHGAASRKYAIHRTLHVVSGSFRESRNNIRECQTHPNALRFDYRCGKCRTIRSSFHAQLLTWPTDIYYGPGARSEGRVLDWHDGVGQRETRSICLYNTKEAGPLGIRGSDCALTVRVTVGWSPDACTQTLCGDYRVSGTAAVSSRGVIQML
jgi:hypothetical protein